MSEFSQIIATCEDKNLLQKVYQFKIEHLRHKKDPDIHQKVSSILRFLVLQLWHLFSGSAQKMMEGEETMDESGEFFSPVEYRREYPAVASLITIEKICELNPKSIPQHFFRLCLVLLQQLSRHESRERLSLYIKYCCRIIHLLVKRNVVVLFGETKILDEARGYLISLCSTCVWSEIMEDVLRCIVVLVRHFSNDTSFFWRWHVISKNV